jgi:hypothetical protein
VCCTVDLSPRRRSDDQTLPVSCEVCHKLPELCCHSELLLQPPNLIDLNLIIPTHPRAHYQFITSCLCENAVHNPSIGAALPSTAATHDSKPNAPSRTPNFFPARGMADQSGPTHFLESALQTYEQQTGIKFTQHPLAVQIQSCQSDDDINTLLQGQARAVCGIQESDRITKSIKKIPSIVVPLSAAATLAVGLVSQETLMPDFVSLTVGGQASHPAKAIQSSLVILLGVCAIL